MKRVSFLFAQINSDPILHHILPLKPPFFLSLRQEEWKILWHEPKQLLSQLPLGQHYRPPAPGKKIELILYFAYFVIKLWLQSGKNVQGLFFIIGFEPLFSAILEVSILRVPFTCGSSTMIIVTAFLFNISVLFYILLKQMCLAYFAISGQNDYRADYSCLWSLEKAFNTNYHQVSFWYLSWIWMSLNYSGFIFSPSETQNR